MPQKSKLKNNSKESFSGILISSPDKFFSVTKNISKRELAAYYDKISPLILPHLIDRPLTIKRCPSDTKEACFYQKHFTPGFSKAVKPILINETKNKEENPYLYIINKRGLLSLIQFDTLEIHPWGSKKLHLEKPDRIIFDLDPHSTIIWPNLIKASLIVRNELKSLGLKSFVKTSGGKGLHIVVPIMAKNSWEEIKSFAYTVACYLAQKYPELFTEKLPKAKRINKIFIDYLRNAREATAVAAYSTRALKGAPISMPFSWEELPNVKSSQAINIHNVFDHLETREKDPWRDFFKCRQSINKILKGPMKK